MLTSTNFETFIIFISDNSIISEIKINYDGFSSNNVSMILGNDTKYKIMANNISIPEGTEEILIRVVINHDNKYFNRYHYLPIKNINSVKNYQSVGRAINYKIENNMICRLWLYFTHSYVLNIINSYHEDCIVPNDDYIREYYY